MLLQQRQMTCAWNDELVTQGWRGDKNVKNHLLPCFLAPFTFNDAQVHIMNLK